MKRKRNILKRNSGFIVTCVIAAGASFFGSDMLLSRYMPLDPGSIETAEPSKEAELPPEKEEARTYETDAFTVTASGSVIKGMESERTAANLQSTEEETDSEISTEAQEERETSDSVPETDDRPSVPETDGESSVPETDSGSSVPETDSGSSVPETDSESLVPDTESGNESTGGGTGSGNGSSGSGNGSTGGGTGSGNESSGGGTGSGNGSSGGGTGSGNESTGSGSGSGSSTLVSGPNITIVDPGNGDYIYGNGENLWESGGSDSGGGSDNDSGGSGESGAWTPDDVMLWGISSRYIGESELYSFSSSQIRVLRNEILALNGRIFQSQDLIDYFSSKSWYTPMYSPDEFDANMFYYLNDYEEANLKLILSYEETLW